jgi:hypothetical protein
MPRKLPDLQVYANPWHGPLDHNHRACTAYPWDPKDNPGRGHVGAHHRLDDDGELYFEFEQYEGTHAPVLAPLKGEERKAKAQELIDTDPDGLVLREKHAAIRIPNTLHYLKGIQSGALLAADLATYVTAFGRSAGFHPVEELASDLAKHRAEAHEYHFGEKPDPKPRPAHGAGRLGMAHAHRAIEDRPQSAVIAAPPGTPNALTPGAAEKWGQAAKGALDSTIAANAKKAAAQAAAANPTPTTDAPKGQ